MPCPPSGHERSTGDELRLASELHVPMTTASANGCPCPSHPNRTFCPLDPALGQCDRTSQPCKLAGGSCAHPSLDACAKCNSIHNNDTCPGWCTFPIYVSSNISSTRWKPFHANVTLGLNFSGQWSIAAPWILPNGTTYIVLQTQDWPEFYPPSLRGETIGTVVRADSWQGPYTVTARGACGPVSTATVAPAILQGGR